MKRPILCCFDIDGTLAHTVASDVYETEDTSALLDIPHHPNVIRIALQSIEMPNAEVMFLTGRPVSQHGVTWRWLNRLLNVARSPTPCRLVCRPDSLGLDAIARFKLSELVQAIRRQPEKLAELRCYDDRVENLRLMQTLRPMVSMLRLFRCEDGVATQWSL